MHAKVLLHTICITSIVAKVRDLHNNANTKSQTKGPTQLRFYARKRPGFFWEMQSTCIVKYLCTHGLNCDICHMHGGKIEAILHSTFQDIKLDLQQFKASVTFEVPGVKSVFKHKKNTMTIPHPAGRKTKCFAFVETLDGF